MSLFKSSKTDKTETKKTPAAPVAVKDMYTAEAKTKTTAKAKAKTSSGASRAYHVLLRPLVSEKASRQQSSVNQYFFEVAINSNKIEIAKAVEAAYGIRPIKVNIIRLEGKSRRSGRTVGKQKNWKKAVVTLPKGKTITLYEGV